MSKYNIDVLIKVFETSIFKNKYIDNISFVLLSYLNLMDGKWTFLFLNVYNIIYL